MPRSSRRKSHRESKHSSRDAGDYPEYEKGSSLEDRKGREESSARVSKDSGSGEKRKFSKEGKDVFVSASSEFSEDYSALRERKDKVDEGLSDRWNGCDDDRVECSHAKASVDSKSRPSKRYGDLIERKYMNAVSEEAKCGSGKVESKHMVDRDLTSKEHWYESEKEGGLERERKGKEVKAEMLIDNW